MNCIESKELPLGWLVTDTHYPSGNTQFAKEKHRNTPTYSGLLGTRHIQLVAANVEIIVEYGDIHEDGYSSVAYFEEDRFEDVDAHIAAIAQEQGKDFFIYKVTEEK